MSMPKDQQDRRRPRGRAGEERSAHRRPSEPGRRDEQRERKLDEGLELTFPASDPVSITPAGD
jgi:hypothetical protein